MTFKGISYLVLWWPFYSAENNHLCNFSRGYPEEQFFEIIMNFLSGALAASCSVEWTHLYNFERGYHGEHSCEVI